MTDKNNQPLLEVNNLKTYFYTEDGVVKAVDGVDFAVKRGEVLGLVGESGCGKSVTSLSIMRLIGMPGKIIEGEIQFDGQNLLDLPEAEMVHMRGNRISMIFQQPQSSLNPVFKVGDQIEAGGPVGKFTFTGTEADSIVLIAAGVGITPMVSITRYLTERSWPGDIFFIYTCRIPADFIFGDEVAALQHRNPKLRVAVTITKAEGTDWKGPRGRITKELLTQTVPDLASRRIHVCGPPAMMDPL